MNPAPLPASYDQASRPSVLTFSPQNALSACCNTGAPRGVSVGNEKRQTVKQKVRSPIRLRRPPQQRPLRGEPGQEGLSTASATNNRSGASPVIAGKATLAIAAASIPCADSNTICARRQVTIGPLRYKGCRAAFSWPHSALQMMSPVDYEQALQGMQAA